MSQFRSKRNKYDTTFSRFIVLRDGMCQRCGRMGIRLECSHIYGRAAMGVRCDPDNAKALCNSCHRWWHSNPSEAFEWLLGVIGQEKYDRLRVKANRPTKLTAWDKDLIRSEQETVIKQMEKGEFPIPRFNPAFRNYPRMFHVEH